MIEFGAVSRAADAATAVALRQDVDGLVAALAALDRAIADAAPHRSRPRDEMLRYRPPGTLCGQGVALQSSQEAIPAGSFVSGRVESGVILTPQGMASASGITVYSRAKASNANGPATQHVGPSVESPLTSRQSATRIPTQGAGAGCVLESWTFAYAACDAAYVRRHDRRCCQGAALP